MVNNDLDTVFLALAHPVRRQIVERLTHGPATVGDATRGVTISKPAVTKHLRALERAGVLRRQAQGRTHRLELDVSRLRDAERWLADNAVMWERKFDVIERHLAEQHGGTGSTSARPTNDKQQKGRSR
jgi:DNA-binding transcriptional ArsR family regulator